jgi:hypothetical protein
MTKRIKYALAAAAAFGLIGATEAAAQTPANGTVTATVTVNGRARLDLSTNAIAFADADPTATPSIQADVPVDIQAQVRTAPTTVVSLTVSAPDFTAAGGATIGVGALTWTIAGPAGFTGGTAANTAVSVGSWTGSGARNGSQTYFLANSWDWAPGTYTTTLTYTLSTP